MSSSLDRKIYDFFRRKTLSDIRSMELIGEARIGLEQGAGILLDGTGEWDDQYALRIHASVAEADVAAYPYTAIYATMTFSEDQNKGLSGFVVWSELYLTGVDLTGSANYAAIWGNVCVDGTVVSSTGLLACLWGAMNLPAGFTNMGRLGGVMLDSQMASGASLIAGSATAAAVFVSKGVDNKLPWPYGFYVMDSAALVGIKVGASQGAGIILDGANGFGYNQACQIHTSITATNRTASAYAGVYSTMSIAASQNKDLSAFAVWGELWLNNVTLTGASNFAAVWGNVIISATTVGPTSGWIAAVWGVVNSAAAFTNNGMVAGVAADCELITGVTDSGKIAAFYATKGADSNKMAWPIGIYIPSGAATKLFDMTAALTGAVGIDGAKLAFTAGTTSSAVVSHGGSEGLYIYQEITGAKTGTARTEALSIVVTASGSGTSPYIYCQHIHWHTPGNPTISSLFGLQVDLDNPGSACDNCIAIDVYRDGANSANTRDAGIRIANGGSAIVHEALLIEGRFTNLFEIELAGGDSGCCMLGAPGGSVTHKIRISIPTYAGHAEVEAWIPVYTG